MSISQSEAAAALDAMSDAKRKFGGKAPWGWRFSIGVGAICAYLVAITPLPPHLWWPSLALFGLMVFGFARWQRAATGRFVNGYRPGRTRWVAIALVVAILGGMLFAERWRSVGGEPNAFLYVALPVFVLGMLADRLWIRAYEADMRDGR